MDEIGGRIKGDISNTTLSKWLVIKNLDDSVDVDEHCLEYITVLNAPRRMSFLM